MRERETRMVEVKSRPTRVFPNVILVRNIYLGGVEVGRYDRWYVPGESTQAGVKMVWQSLSG